MKRHLLTASLLALFCGKAAHADDWLQFRHDASHTGVSRDTLKFPLKEAWTWKTKAKGGHTPLFHAVVRAGKIYFTASEKDVRSLICADAKTGKVIWRRPLETEKLAFALSDSVGPAITASGLVFAYDWMHYDGQNTSPEFFRAIAPKETLDDLRACISQVDMVDSFAVRVYDAEKGKQQAHFPMAAMGANGVLPRLSLVEGGDGQEVYKVPPTFAGCPP